MRHASVSLLAILLLGAGCGPDTGLPQPVPVPRPSLLRATGPQQEDVEVQVRLLGLPGAAGGGERVTVLTPTAELSTRSHPTGSFALRVPAAVGDELTVRFEDLSTATLTIEPSVELPVGPAVIESQKSGGTLGLEATIGAAFAAVIVANFGSGETLSTTSDAAGRVDIALEAQPGDVIAIFRDFGTLTEIWSAVAP